VGGTWQVTLLTRAIPERPRDECQLIIRRYRYQWFLVLYHSQEISGTCLENGAFPEADGNVWGAPYRQAETY